MRMLPLILCTCTMSFSFQDVFHQEWIHWRDPQIQIVSVNLPTTLQVNEFCLSLALENPNLGHPDCRVGGEWLRDSASAVYIQWLQANANPHLTPHDLASRNKSVVQRLHELDDKYLLILYKRGDTLWSQLYSGARTIPTTARPTEPIAMGFMQATNPDAKSIATALTSWFSGSTQVRLNDDEKKFQAAQPDLAYSEVPDLDTWIGLGIGWSQAQIPLTPSSWYAIRKDRVQNYRFVKDSSSAWSILEDRVPTQNINLGFTWSGFLGLELFAVRSVHDVKYNALDSAYLDLDHWRFTRTEFGLTAHMNYPYKISPSFEWDGFAFLGFHYSILSEDIALRKGAIASSDYKYRIGFEDSYKGAIFGVGNRLLWSHRLGLEARLGISNRGKNLDQEPSADAVSEPTIVGASTLDCFISAALEYHLLPMQKSSAKASR